MERESRHDVKHVPASTRAEKLGARAHCARPRSSFFFHILFFKTTMPLTFVSLRDMNSATHSTHQTAHHRPHPWSTGARQLTQANSDHRREEEEAIRELHVGDLPEMHVPHPQSSIKDMHGKLSEELTYPDGGGSFLRMLS